ncbi:hypothetical protein LTR62_002592 [Meristemomyces frigidus]|uniref:Uncharacterized protein n=1 Tax=Meristemomyces frigidus TaxID=1508187 RepID=A0AAN7TJG2_9PEZI|nr:hypothetical protein LTR62_002592 [Meristemomyces frigidus]
MPPPPHKTSQRILAIFWLSLALSTASPFSPSAAQHLLAPAGLKDQAVQAQRPDYLTASPNAVGLLVTFAEGVQMPGGREESVLLWLPMGRRVYTLPPEDLDHVICRVFPKYSRVMELQDRDALPIEIRRSDDRVDLAEKSHRPRSEVAAYECS